MNAVLLKANCITGVLEIIFRNPLEFLDFLEIIFKTRFKEVSGQFWHFFTKMDFFCKNTVVNKFCRKLYRRCLAEFEIRLCYQPSLGKVIDRAQCNPSALKNLKTCFIGFPCIIFLSKFFTQTAYCKTIWIYLTRYLFRTSSDLFLNK